ncbi:MAG: CcmD family protein [Chloroflexia bacterium]
MDSGLIYLGAAFSLVWLTLLGYMGYLARRAREAERAMRNANPRDP